MWSRNQLFSDDAILLMPFCGRLRTRERSRKPRAAGPPPPPTPDRHGIGQTAQAARDALARLLSKICSTMSTHAVHLRPAAHEDDAAADLLLQPHLLQSL